MKLVHVIISPPRLYLTLYLFGREVNFNLGWFKDDTDFEWKFGPILTLGKLSGKGWRSYSLELGFSAFTRQLVVAVGVIRYDD